MSGMQKRARAEQPSLLNALPGIGAAAGGLYGASMPHHLLPGSWGAEAGRYRVLAGLLGAGTGASLAWLPKTFQDTHAYLHSKLTKPGLSKHADAAAVDVKTDPDTTSVPGDPSEETGERNGQPNAAAQPAVAPSMATYHKGGPIRRDGFLTGKDGRPYARVQQGERVISRQEVGKRKIAGPILAMMLRQLRAAIQGSADQKAVRDRRRLQY